MVPYITSVASMPEAAARATHSVLCDKIALLGCDLYSTTLQQTLWISSPLGNVFCFMWVPHCTNTSLFIEIALRVCFPVEQQYWEVYQASQRSNCVSGIMYQKESQRKENSDIKHSSCACKGQEGTCDTLLYSFE